MKLYRKLGGMTLRSHNLSGQDAQIFGINRGVKVTFCNQLTQVYLKSGCKNIIIIIIIHSFQHAIRKQIVKLN